MSLKDKLVDLRKKLVDNKDELTSQVSSKCDAYRLVYLNIIVPANDEITDKCFDYDTYNTFKLPENMDQEDFFKLLTRLKDNIGNAVFNKGTTNKLSSLVYKFECRRAFNVDEDKVLNLFIIDGDLKYFKRSKYYSKYFDWNRDATDEEIKEICKKNNINSNILISSDKHK